eukprot:7385757-Prymnesium_polylepis.1
MLANAALRVGGACAVQGFRCAASQGLLPGVGARALSSASTNALLQNVKPPPLRLIAGVVAGATALYIARNSVLMTDAGITYVVQNNLTGSLEVYTEPGKSCPVRARAPSAHDHCRSSPFTLRTVPSGALLLVRYPIPPRPDRQPRWPLDGDHSLRRHVRRSHSGHLPIQAATARRRRAQAAPRVPLGAKPRKVASHSQRCRRDGRDGDAVHGRGSGFTRTHVACSPVVQPHRCRSRTRCGADSARIPSPPLQEFFQGGLNQFKTQLADQLQNGIYLTERRQVEVEQTDLAPVGSDQSDDSGRRGEKLVKAKQLVWKTVPLYDKAGGLRRAENPLSQYGIDVTQ